MALLQPVKIFQETDSNFDDFLGNTCKLWEKTADKFQKLGIKTVKIRTGIVLSKQGGALNKMLLPIQLGFGSALGNGKQYIPWIHIDDLCNIYIKALEDTKMNGVYNAVAPNHTTNEEFNKTIASVLNKPFWFPNIPAFIIRLIFGKMSSLILNGSRISSEKIQTTGYQFLFPNLANALKNFLIN